MPVQLMTPTLMTPTMIGKPMQPRDLGAMLLLNRDVTVMSALAPDGNAFPESVVRDFVEDDVAHWQEHGFGTWLFCNNTNGNFLGYAGLRQANIDGADEVELRFAVRSPYWGAGLGTQMAKAVVDVAIDQIELGSLLARTLAGNQRAQRVLKRLRFSYQHDLDHDGILYALYRRNA